MIVMVVVLVRVHDVMVHLHHVMVVVVMVHLVGVVQVLQHRFAVVVVVASASAATAAAATVVRHDALAHHMVRVVLCANGCGYDALDDYVALSGVRNERVP